MSPHIMPNKLPWFKRHEQALVIFGLAGFVLGILGILVSIYLTHPEIGIGTDQDSIDVPQGDVIPVTVKVDDLHWPVRPFNQNVKLSVDSDQWPAKTIIKFAPVEDTIPTFHQAMIISALPNAPIGPHQIKIWARCPTDSPSNKCIDFTINIIP